MLLIYLRTKLSFFLFWDEAEPSYYDQQYTISKTGSRLYTIFPPIAFLHIENTKGIQMTVGEKFGYLLG
jgi:hypothetical protein